MRLAVLFVLLLPLAAAARDFADAFERDADNNGAPDGWSVAPGSSGAEEGKLTLGPGKDGRGLVLGTAASTTAAAETRLTGRLDLANDYVLSAWIRVEGGEGATAALSVQFIDERGDPLGPPQPTASASPRDDWTLVALPASLIDSRTRALSIRVTLSNRSGAAATVRADDVAWVAKAFVDGFEADLDKDAFPDRWRSVAGEEFPSFNAVRTKMVAEEVRSGGRSAGLVTQGRSVGLETRWAVTVDPDRSYELTAQVKTRGLTASSAWVEIEWLDDAEVQVGIDRTNRVRDTGDKWVAVTLAADEVPARAKKVRLRLLLGGDDAAGQAWFDDVEWLGRVRVRLDTQGRAGNVYGEKEAIEAGGAGGTLVALGLEAGAWEVFAVVRDPDGAIAWQGQVGAEELTVRENLAIPFRFPATTPGLYDVRIEIRANGRPAVQAKATFGIAHEPIFPRGRGGEFGLSFNPYLNSATTPGAILKGTLAGRVRVPLWDPSERDRPGLDPAGTAMHERLLDLRRNGLDIIGVLDAPPGAATGRSLADFFGARNRGWEEPLGALAASHRDVVAWWLIGDTDASLLRLGDATLLDTIAARLRASNEFAAMGLTIPAGAAVPASEGVAFHVVPSSAPRDKAGHGERVVLLQPGSAAEIARRCVEARAAGETLAMIGGSGSAFVDATGAPTEAWFALRVVNDLLSTATPVDGDLLPGQPAFRRSEAIVVALRADPARAFDAWVGSDVRIVDLSGRSRRLTPDATGRVTLQALPEMTFAILGERAFAETQLSAGLDGVPLLSRANEQRVTFRLLNRFASPVKNVRIVSIEMPRHWRPVSSELETTEVAAGGRAEFPLEVGVPTDARPGRFEVRIRVTFTVDGQKREALLIRAFEVRPEIEVTPRIEPTADNAGLEVSVVLRNRGVRKLDFKVYLNRGEGSRTLDEVVYGLEPGAERLVRFLVEKDTKGREYQVGVRGIEDDLFVNEAVSVP